MSYPSLRKTAAALGITVEAFRKRMKRADWRWGKPPYTKTQVEQMRKHAATNLQSDRSRASRGADDEIDTFGGLSSVGKVDVALKLERTKRARLEREIIEGKHHSIADCAAEVGAMIHAAKARLLAIPRAIAPSLVGLSAQAIETALDQRLREALTELARDAK